MKVFFSCRFLFDINKEGGAVLKRFFLIFTLISTVIAAFLVYRYRKQLLEKLERLEDEIKKLNLKAQVKSTVSDTIGSLKNIVKKSKGKPEEKEETLRIVEQKIRQLEELIKR